MSLPPDLQDSLLALGRALQTCRDDWALIGSAALTLHGIDAGDVGDLDILLSADDARSIAKDYGIAVQAPAEHSLFRSDVFFGLRLGQYDVDFMANFHVRKAGELHQVPVPETEPVQLGKITLKVATLDAMKALLTLFGRPKDLARLRRL
ncbi:hypothetical protein [Henriciella aquimarina]|uniref:hypothetical protein n=1 Tax=Henriciella aquimarina TaxID=545261 RepID=UPI0009FE5BA1|nr:hypothetical protein [Henriciella aquimarina]